MTKIIAIDTEFERHKTYKPILSLVQIKEEGQEPVIYDILSANTNINTNNNKENHKQQIKHLKTLLSDDKVIKIIHALRQDVEAIYECFGIIMHNLFDTQIAVKCLHGNNEIGYAKMVEKYCNKQILKEKRLQNSNWMKRPLTNEQEFYAKQDVLYLHDIYYKLMQEFKKPENEKEYIRFKAECLYYENEDLYKFNPLSVWQKNKHKIGFTTNYQLIKDLFILREKIAYSTNLPREFVIKLKNMIAFAETKDVKYLKLHFKVKKQPFLNCLKKYNEQ